LKYSLTKVQNSMGNSKNYVKKHLLIICTTSWNHFEIDKLAKWMVQIVKQGLQKYGLQKGHFENWDL